MTDLTKSLRDDSDLGCFTSSPEEIFSRMTAFGQEMWGAGQRGGMKLGGEVWRYDTVQFSYPGIAPCVGDRSCWMDLDKFTWIEWTNIRDVLDALVNSLCVDLIQCLLQNELLFILGIVGVSVYQISSFSPLIKTQQSNICHFLIIPGKNYSRSI